ncbi:MAG: transposase, partial [Candidatus Tectomicrobia bacterium]
MTSRGNARAPIYTDDADRTRFLDLLTDVTQHYNWLCHAFCLMDNHYHLVLETLDGNLSQGMRQLNGIFTQRFNQRHQRVGHIFQGRSKAIVVDRESSLLTLCRYVVLNPVRASMVVEVEAYHWSSYRATAGLSPCPPWLQTDWLLGQFDTNRLQAQQRYRAFVQDGLDYPAPWDALKGQIFLAPDDYITQIQTHLRPVRSVKEVPRAQRYADRPALRDVLGNRTSMSQAERDRLIYDAYRSYGYSMTSIAGELGMHNSTISR